MIIGTLEDGTKELLAVHAGYRESKLSWIEILQGLKKRGLENSPKLAVGDGYLGFWAAISEEYPETKHQRCWVHKTSNVRDKMPKRVQQYHTSPVLFKVTAEAAFLLIPAEDGGNEY